MTNQPNRPKPAPKKSEEEILQNIVETFSDKRIASYNSSDYKKAVRLYQINLMLCEALYPSLHCLEIALRNSIDREVSNKYGEFWFFPNYQLFIDEIQKISESIFSDKNNKQTVQQLYFSVQNKDKDTFLKDENLLSQGTYAREKVVDSLKNCVIKYYDNHLNGQPVNIEFNRNKIISDLSLGFWVALLLHESKYRKIFNLNPKIFKHSKRTDRYDSEGNALFTAYLKEIRKLRNRVFHHNKILKEDLQTKHTRIINIIDWISPDTKSWLNDIDRFNEVYKKYENEIESWKKEIRKL
ncbi:Abi family protein [Planktothrix agardhii]|jgi:hypothetical protein|nr:Abi family protein [Planktothrix agardhii]MCB8761764.1 Abi family protein [Planktothrix agardhii 1813]